MEERLNLKMAASREYKNKAKNELRMENINILNTLVDAFLLKLYHNERGFT